MLIASPCPVGTDTCLVKEVWRSRPLSESLRCTTCRDLALWLKCLGKLCAISPWRKSGHESVCKCYFVFVCVCVCVLCVVCA